MQYLLEVKRGYMHLSSKEIKKSLKHAGILALRVFGLYATYQYLIAPIGIMGAAGQTASSFSIGQTTTSIASKLTGTLLSLIQLPGTYNQGRHLLHHATAVMSNNKLSKQLNELSHQLPHVEGPVTHAKNLYHYVSSKGPKAC